MLAICCMAVKTVAQQRYTTHVVKEGETLETISKLYRVTPYSILQHNPEIPNATAIGPHTILKIPVLGTGEEAQPATEAQEGPEKIEPITFIKHRVRRKETMFGLTQKYKVTEAQIKRYNAELYASELQKGMVLQIPEYPDIEVEEERELDFDTYRVQAKETRWSVAHKFGISIDSLVLLNPELPKNTSFLAEGQELKVPRPKGDSLEDQETIIYESYTVPKAIGLFRVSQEYGIPTDSIIKLNPQVKLMGGLREGMVLRLPKKTPESDAINADNYIFYEVKPKQGIFRLTQELNTSRDSLFMYNPELQNGVKAGMVLKLPKSKMDQLEVKNSLILGEINLADSLDVFNRPKVVFMLPFRLDRINFDNEERIKSQVKRKDIGAALGIYTGAMVALDSIAKLGLSVDVGIVDTQRNLQVVRDYFNTQTLFGVDAVVGPVDPSLLNEIAVRSVGYNVPIIAPFAAENELGFDNLFFSMPKKEVYRKKLLDHIKKIHKDEELIIVADAKHHAARDSILSHFPTARIAKMSEDGSLHLVDFEAMLFEDKTHWVFMETEDSNLASSVTSIMNAANSEELYTVRMFSTSFSNAFESGISPTHLSNLKFTFPSAYRGVGQDAFTAAYQKKYGYLPNRYAIRGFDLTFDLLLKLGYKKNLFEVSQFIGQTEYSGNRFNYVNQWSMGHYNQAAYILQYDDLNIVEIKENDIKSNL